MLLHSSLPGDSVRGAGQDPTAGAGGEVSRCSGRGGRRWGKRTAVCGEMSATHNNNKDQELSRAWCHNDVTSALLLFTQTRGCRVHCFRGPPKGSSAVGRQVSGALGGLAPSGHLVPSAGDPGPCFLMSPESPGGTGGQVSPTDAGWGASGRNPVHRRHWQRLGGNVHAAIVCRYLGSRNAHTRHA